MRRKLKLVAWLLTGLSASNLGLAQGLGVGWADLSTQQQELLELLGEHESTWADLSPARQEQIATGAERWLEMGVRQRDQASSRFERWQSLDANQRARIRDRYQVYRDMTPEDRARVQASYQRYQNLPPDRRQELQRRFRTLTPDQVRALRDTRSRPSNRAPDRPGAARGMGR